MNPVLLETIEMGEGSNTESPPPSQPPQLKHWFFTFNNYTKNDIEILERTFNHLCYMYCFQEETGEQGTPHLQGVISLIKRARWTEFGLPRKIHWERVEHVPLAYAYCSKIETRTGQIYTKNYSPPKQLRLLNREQMYGWQIGILNLITQEPDDRTVNWYWSKEGRTGKSTFAKYLVAKCNALFFEEGKKADVMKLIFDTNMDTHNVVVIDVPRDNGNRVSYKSIEAIKNGMIYSSKYEGGYKLFNPPHIFIFANEPPNMARLSYDRWEVRNIDL